MAHRVVALQERTQHAPPLTAITYSILLKGYGRLKDMNNVEMLLSHAKASEVEPDLIMVNSLLDAYINCGEWSKAKEVNTLQGYDEYLALYPEGEYALEAKKLKLNLDHGELGQLTDAQGRVYDYEGEIKQALPNGKGKEPGSCD